MNSHPEEIEEGSVSGSEDAESDVKKSDDVAEKDAKKWSRKEMEEAEPYPIPEVPDD